jgi:hypothetical protein
MQFVGLPCDKIQGPALTGNRCCCLPGPAGMSSSCRYMGSWLPKPDLRHASTTPACQRSVVAALGVMHSKNPNSQVCCKRLGPQAFWAAAMRQRRGCSILHIPSLRHNSL